MFRSILVPLFLLVAVPAHSVDPGGTPAGERPRVGLVLAGGGARGIAHVGVIQALEEMRVPVDAVAGTSMGALVGGLYASGMDEQALSEVVATLDWERAFEDRLDRDELPPRRKSDDFDYPSDIHFSIQDGGVSLPLGVVQGQQVRLMIKELMQGVAHIRDFDQLPTPYRAVATDIETGEAYVFREGDIVTAMRASMSLPGLLAPVEHEGRLLLDGGMANNIPVDVARGMGVDRLIVVDIGTPLKSRDEISSLLSVADQVLGFLTRKNSLQQLATLGNQDVLVRPELEGLGMLDFEQTLAIQEQGYLAAKALSEPLAGLSVSEDEWAAYLDRRALATPAHPTIDFIAIDNDSPVSDQMIELRIRQSEGEMLDRDQLQEDIASIYALGYWEIIDYELVRQGSDTGLLVTARSKTWGTDTLKLGLNLLTDLEGNSDINLGTSYLFKGLNSRGGELYARLQLGDTMLLSGEYYQPFDFRGRYFFAPYLGYTDYQVLSLGPEYDLRDLVGAWRVRDFRGELAVGANLRRDSQFKLGLFQGIGEYRLDLARDDALPEDSYRQAGAYASYRFDNLDDAFFPTRGALLYTDYETHLEDFGGDNDFQRWRVTAQAAMTFGADQRNTVLVSGKLGQTWDASNQPQNYFQLGGLFNVSGLSQNFYSGRQMGFLMAQYQRRLSGDSVIPLDMPVYLGASLEGGQLWSERSDMAFDDLITAGSIYLGIDSPLGPIYLAYGRAEDSFSAVYLALGWPFMVGNDRLRR